MIIIITEVSSGNLYREIGRTFGVMMSQKWFECSIRNASSKYGVLRCIDHFMDRTIVIPQLTETDVAEYNQECEHVAQEEAKSFDFLSWVCFPRINRRDNTKLHVNILPECSRNLLNNKLLSRDTELQCSLDLLSPGSTNTKDLSPKVSARQPIAVNMYMYTISLFRYL